MLIILSSIVIIIIVITSNGSTTKNSQRSIRLKTPRNTSKNLGKYCRSVEGEGEEDRSWRATPRTLPAPETVTGYHLLLLSPPVLPRQIPPSPSSLHVQLPFSIVTLFTLQNSIEFERFGPTFGGKTVFSFMTYPPCQRLHQIQSLPTLHAPCAILGGY